MVIPTINISTYLSSIDPELHRLAHLQWVKPMPSERNRRKPNLLLKSKICSFLYHCNYEISTINAIQWQKIELIKRNTGSSR